MKLSLRFTAIVLITILFLASNISSVKAISAPETVSNPAAEQYVLDQVLSGQIADLSIQFSNEKDRAISADFLSALMTGDDLQNQTQIQIDNAIIVGDLKMEASIVPIDVYFANCKFEGIVDLSRAVLKDFYLEDSTFFGQVNMDRTSFNGDLALTESIFQNAVSINEADISRSLLASDAHFLSTKAGDDMDHAFELWAATIGFSADFSNTVFYGTTLFDQSRFTQADFSQVIFKDETSFEDSIVDTNALFQGATFEKEANFSNFFTGNYANYTDATFNGSAVFDYSTFSRFIDFINTTFDQEFSFYYTTAGWPDIENTVFNNTVNFEGMQVTADFVIFDSQYLYPKKPFYFSLVNVSGRTVFQDFSAPAGINFSYSKLGSLTINSGEKTELDSINLTNTEINSELLMENITTKNFIAEGVTILKSTELKNLDITEKLDMRNAGVSFLKINDSFHWPEDPTAFNLRGMTYSDIDLGDQGLTEDTWQGLLLLVNKSAYSPQSYLALTQFLIDKGHSEWANEVELAQKRRERNEVLTPFSGAWLWSWFLDIFSGYGQRPSLALIWSGLVIANGAYVFRRREDMVPIEQDGLELEYNPIWYSFALFIPYIDLGIAGKWEPNTTHVRKRYYKYIHMILGWILAPIALLSFSGVFG